MNITRHSQNNFVWIDIISPEEASLKNVFTEFAISENLLQEIVFPTLRAKAEFEKDAIYVSLHFPIKRGHHFANIEIDFILKKEVIITSHYEEIPFLEKFLSEFANFNVSKKGHGQEHGGAYFAYFIRSFYKEIEKDLDDITIEVQLIEKEIFKGDERKSIEDISIARRKIFDFEAAMRFHKEVLESYCATALSFFGREYTTYAEFIMSDYFKMWNTIEHLKNMLIDLKDTNDFLINHKTNQLVKSFTAISYIVLPLSFVAGFFGMNAKFPDIFVNNQYGLLYIMGILLSFAFLIFVYLNNKKWF